MINSFDYKNHQFVSIPKNEKMRSKWDLEEKKGFINGLIFGKIYKIRNLNTGNEHALSYLGYIDRYIHTLKEEMAYNPQLCHSKGCSNESSIFIITPHTLQEIPDNTIFEGINKPKFIVKSPQDGLYFQKDNDYRAGRRHIMLSIRTKNGKLRSWRNVKRLLLHELAHTMCNHVTYREAGNHEHDFHKCEKFLKKISENSPNVKRFEYELLNNLF